MKIRIPTKGDQGSTLLPCLCIAVVAGYALASCLSASFQQYVSVVRSEYWNRAMIVSEAGIEDGLQLINQFSGDWGQLEQWNTPPALSGANWETYTNNCYHVQRTIGSDTYDVFVINDAANNPRIISEATVNFPYAFSSTFNFAGAGLNDSGDRTVKRQVEVQTMKAPLFDVAVAALDRIDFNGRSFQSDSFTSGDYVTFANGLYDATKARSKGDVVTDGSIINSQGTGSATINGRVKTGPNGTIAIGAGRVGEKSWTASNTGIQPNWSADDMNVKFPDVKLPLGFDSLPLTSQNQLGDWVGPIYINYHFKVSGDYKVSMLNGGVYVDPGAKVRLYITGNYEQKNNEVIQINSDGGGNSGRLQIYAGGTCKLAGFGVANLTGYAANFALYGLPTCTSIEFNNNSSFMGVIYAPQADFKLGGGDNYPHDFVGSIMAKSITLNGNFNFHYDENLANIGAGLPARGYIPTQWLETQPQ